MTDLRNYAAARAETNRILSRRRSYVEMAGLTARILVLIFAVMGALWCCQPDIPSPVNVQQLRAEAKYRANH